MNHEQLAFFNQQLAGMLKSGLPLEGSLRQLSASMRRGELRDEIAALEADLAQGVPLEQAIEKRRLPDLYKSMLRAGARSGDLPGVLTMAADHYAHTHATWLRLKGLMVYPGLVLITAFSIAVLLGAIYTHMLRGSAEALGGMFGRPMNLWWMQVSIWLPVLFIAGPLVLFLATVFIRPLRQRARWVLPGFRESSLSQLASTIAVLLENGTDLGTAISVAERNESHPRVQRELSAWKQRLAAGARHFHEIAPAGRVVPAFFVWLVAGAGENWARGFRRAAQAYDNRARFRTELLLYAALPVTILLLGIFIVTEAVPVMQGFIRMMNDLGGVTDGGW